MPAMGGVLPGLTMKARGDLVVTPSACARCGGHGLRIDHEHNRTEACDLNLRLARVRALIERYQKIHQVTALPLLREADLPAAPFSAALKRLAEIRAGKSVRGLIYLDQPTGPKLSVWSVALAAAWRFGFDAQVVTLDRGAKAAMHVPVIPGASTGKFLLFIENGERLWQTKVAEDFEQLVSFAYGAMAPLWAAFRPSTADASMPAENAASRLNVKRELNRKVSHAKSKPPLAWVAPETRSRLAAVADVAATLWPKADISQRAKAGSSMPRLPWDH